MAEAAAEEQVDGIVDELDQNAVDDEEEAEVELEDGQVEVYADLAGYDDIPFVMEENDVDELSEQSLAVMEQDLDSVQVRACMHRLCILTCGNVRWTAAWQHGASWGSNRMTACLAAFGSACREHHP